MYTPTGNKGSMSLKYIQMLGEPVPELDCPSLVHDSVVTPAHSAVAAAGPSPLGLRTVFSVESSFRDVPNRFPVPPLTNASRSRHDSLRHFLKDCCTTAANGVPPDRYGRNFNSDQAEEMRIWRPKHQLTLSNSSLHPLYEDW